MKYITKHLEETGRIAGLIDPGRIRRMIELLIEIRGRGGRLFLIGAGGGAGIAAHAVNDFRKIAGIEAYSPVDNVSELTARVNDEGWETVFSEWLKVSRLRPEDGVFVFSVGGGDAERGISANIVEALRLAADVGATILGVVGRDGGYTAREADACLVVPTVSPESVTPHTEAFQSVILHLIASHPDMKQTEMKWESEVSK